MRYMEFLVVACLPILFIGCGGGGAAVPAAGVISGQVVDASNISQPVPDTYVYVPVPPPPRRQAEELSAISDSQGNYEISGLEPGQDYEVFVDAPGAYMDTHFLVYVPEVGAVDQRICLLPAGMDPLLQRVYPDPSNLTIEETLRFQFTKRQEGPAQELTPTWSVSGGIGTVSPGGLFSATAPGPGTLYVSLGSKFGTADITVLPAPNLPRIVFHSNRDNPPDDYNIFVMDWNGENVHRLTDNPAKDMIPVWSPDGAQIAFVSTRDAGPDSIMEGGDVFVMSPDGTNQVNISNSPQHEWFITGWSPDSSRIAFSRFSAPNRADIWTVGRDGSSPQQITNRPGIATGPNFHPTNANLLAFQANWAGNFDCYLMDLTTQEVTQLTDVGVPQEQQQWDGHPVWAPDGSYLIFFTYRDGDAEIYRMNPDGSNQVNLTNYHDADDWAHTLSPDGSKIAFSSDRSGFHEVWLMNADGSTQCPLTQNPTTNSELMSYRPWFAPFPGI